MKAVVTAGGRVDAAYAAAAGTQVKALAPVRGTTMLERIIAALRAAGVTRLAVVGGEEVRAACGARIERFVEEARSGGENIVRALQAWPEDGEPLLYATSDMPYVTGDAVRDFVRRVVPGTIAIALTEYTDFTARFPEAPPYGIRLAGEHVVNGGIFCVPSGSGRRISDVATRFFEVRKAPWRMATLVGPLTLLLFALGRLRIGQLEAAAEKILGVRSKAVRGCAPELGFDADTLAEYEYARTHA